jgi:hypothetical protein
MMRELGDIVNVGGFLDTQECYDALIEADVNNDRRVTADEYVTVVQIMGPPGFLENVTDFAELPFRIKTTFNALACLCTRSGGASDCCIGDNAHISNEGAAPGEIPTPEQSAYLFTVCLATIRAINAVLEPTVAPSPAPSVMPSMTVPTVEPSAMPTELVPVPSEGPSAMPSSSPTSTPPTIMPVPPTAEPSASPSNPGDTPAPTTTPSPTQSPAIPIPVAYVIQVPNGENVPLTQEEIGDLKAAMDILAPKVADEVFNSNRRLRRRRLDVFVQLPTSIFGTIKTACPPSAPEQDSCIDVNASVTITENEEASSEEVQAAYSAALVEAINEGRLQLALEEVNPNSRIVVEPSVPAPTPAPAAASSGLSAGATAGIAVAAVATFLAAAGLLVARKKRLEKDDEYYAAGTQALADADQNARDARELKDLGEGDAGVVGGAMLGATQADYGKNKSKQAVQTSVVAFDTLEEDVKAGPRGDDESSNAGSSGWSSSAGVSSLNTGSADSLDFTGGQAVGATLAAIGAASAITSRQDSKQADESGPVPNQQAVSRDDLDSAIEAGDWAAVGATAALLAAASDSPDTNSQSSRSGSRSHSSRSGRTGSSAVSSIDAARAAELDHLVDAGDWEGVVLAAAKFEASEDGSKGSSASVSVKSGSATNESRSIGGSTGAASSGISPSSVSDSESPSKQQKRAEIRAEVEALVRRVVPEEIDNVDEMMLQFKGREEELVETLRTMQERAVAQKARVQGQKAAKREARNIVQQGGVELPVPGATATSGEGLSAAETAGVAAGAAAALGVAAGIAAGAKKKKEEEDRDLSDIASGGGDAPMLVHEDASKSESGSASGASSGKRRTALELAIEAGDWEAVGEAAAMMSDTSVTTASTTEVQALAEGVSYDEEDEDVRRMRKAGVNADRAAELDAMIDEGNWTGVVAAASRYSKVDTQTEESSDSSASESKEGQQGKKRSWFGGSSLLDKKPASAPADQDMDVDSMERTADQARKEEEDALAQAEIWMAIANQSKQEGSTDAGASDAADWAIARSLSALRNAEARGELSQPAKSGSSPDEATGSVGESDSKGDRSV